MALLSEEQVRRHVPERLWNTASGLLGLGFRVTYKGPPGLPALAERPARGSLSAKKDDVHLKAVISWTTTGHSEVHLYQIESVAGQRPNLSRRKAKTFWKVAKNVSA